LDFKAAKRAGFFRRFQFNTTIDTIGHHAPLFISYNYNPSGHDWADGIFKLFD